MDEEFDLDDLLGTPQPEKPKSRRGGHREGAGRKPNGYVKPPEVLDFEKARARNEAAKASNNELEFLLKSGQVVYRSAVRQAVATVMLGIVQTLRSIPDVLERQGIEAKVCEHVEKVIDETLESASKDLELMAGSEEVPA